uniref:Helicase C-terminal domain-containing protein n=1 Tax=Hucho hucho TaxID=62062 RepID=A0A4W5QR91_9TELE
MLLRHKRSLELSVLHLSCLCCPSLFQVLERFTGRLIQNRAMSHRDSRSLTKYQLILAREQFRKNPPLHITGAQQGALEGDFALCISLYYGYELLLQMGLRSLFHFVQGIMDGTKEMSRARNELQRNATFMDLYQEMEAMFGVVGLEEPFVYSHPKLQKLEEVVLGHFKTWAESSVSTRVMIFSSFRESVQEIAAMLNRHLPLVKVMTFMGQASAGKGVKGFTQKEQLEVVRRFREGGFNTLVSTCVGEEGLDIGEVDLIVCFDAQKSPIRLVQRMGRTGRKRQGRVVVILAEGREERTYNQSQSNMRSVYKSIVGNSHRFHMFPHSPRMLPEGVHPALHKMHITCGQFDHRESSGRLSGGGRGRRSHSLVGQRDVKKDGFLSPSELTHWESTMKLGEDEAPPILRRSRFLSKQEDSPPPVEPLSSGPTRELSLWEWRHWQNQPFPTHMVDHSNRCHHFTKVMELIDGLRLWPLPSTGDQPIMDMDSDCIILNNESESSEVNSPRDLESESVNCIADVEQIYLKQLTSIADREPKSDDDSELEALFYLPKWDAAVPKLQPLRQRLESLRVILVNVTELLSRSPPALHFDLDSPQFDPGPTPTTKDCSHTLPVEPLDELLDVGQPFQVNFSLEVDEDFADPASQSPNVDLDVGSLDCESHCEPPHHQHSPSSPITVPADSMGRESSVGSPNWDEVFEDDRNDIKDVDMDDKVDFEPPCHPTQPKAQHSKTNLDESMDLFGGDETFLQMTIPDIPTPENVSIRIPSSLKAPEREWSIGSSKSVTQTKMVDQVKPSRSHASPVAQQEPAQDFENFDCSQDFFSVNFDLGWEEDEGDAEAAPTPVPSKPSPPGSRKQEAPLSSSVNGPNISGSSTPPFSFHRTSVSTPLAACPGGKRADTSALTSPLTSKSGALFSPIPTLGPRSTSVSFWRVLLVTCTLDNKVIYSFDSTFPSQQAVQHHHRGARHFLDEEAVLSEGGEVSSDEEDGEEQNRSLEGFVVSNTQCSQGINDSEMQGVYLKSVRSPAVAGKFKMIYKQNHNMDIFSQVPELDETYVEDSFVVSGSDEEDPAEEDEEVPLELIYEDSFVEGRRQYPTRRKALIRNIRRAADPQPNPAGKNKRSRIVHLEDSSSEEEVEKSRNCVKAEGEERCRQRLHQQALLSEELDFEHKPPASSSSPSGLVSVLVDSRCITACVDVVSSLRQRYAVTAHVCSLDGCDFVVSNRMAVERQCHSELAGKANHKRLVERVTSLQGLFERVCLIVEKDRTKPGEASRPFQPTRYYDSTLASLVRAGVRLLVSGGPEESATLLSEMARVEQRKGQAISVPLEVKGHRQQALLFYRTLPCVSYVNALNMSHSFRSVGHLVNSSIEALQKGACVSRPRAEEIYRCLRYSCDTTLMTTNTPRKNDL